MQSPPLQHLARLAKRYPDAWKRSLSFRRDRGVDLPDWPEWCFLPMGGWYAILTESPPFDIHCLAPLAALGAWRYTQGIYRFDTDIQRAISDTDACGDLPVDVLFRLPEWCVYVETPGMTWGEQQLDGFFAFLEWDVTAQRAELRFVFALKGEERLKSALAIHLGEWTLHTALERAMAEARKNAGSSSYVVGLLGEDEVPEPSAEDLYPYLSLLLYICSDEPDVQGHTVGEYPHHARPKKVQGGWQLYPPPKPKIWRVGEVLGAELRTPTGRQPATGIEKASPRPHIRRAHWHGYWSGPIKQTEGKEPDRRFRYKWLPPVMVKGKV